MIDPSILARVLRTLDNLSGADLSEAVLGDEVALDYPRADHGSVQEALRFADRKGYIERFRGHILNDARVRILPAGSSALRDLVP